MKINAIPQILRANSGWRWLFTVLLSHFVLWLLLDAIGALARYGDLEQQGKAVAYVPLWLDWVVSSAGYFLLSSGLYLLVSLKPDLLQSRTQLATLLLFVLGVYLPLELSYCASLYLLDEHKHITWPNLQSAYQALRKSHWFTDGVVMSAVYFAVIALQSWRLQRQREIKWQKTQTDNLNLQLQLEQSRLQALKAQLEPHFIFNALNAISALVRSDDKKLALGAINQLSHLLRYALSVMQQQQVSLQQELDFCTDYLSLQQLRYGARLQLEFAELDTEMQAWPCPPLILQPLLENALRHDLDKHQQCSVLKLSAGFHEHAGQRYLRLQLHNPLRPDLAANPGLGLGLNQVRQQLLHAYAGAARFEIQSSTNEYIVRLDLPDSFANNNLNEAR